MTVTCESALVLNCSVMVNQFTEHTLPLLFHYKYKGITDSLSTFPDNYKLRSNGNPRKNLPCSLHPNLHHNLPHNSRQNPHQNPQR